MASSMYFFVRLSRDQFIKLFFRAFTVKDFWYAKANSTIDDGISRLALCAVIDLSNFSFGIIEAEFFIVVHCLLLLLGLVRKVLATF
tara:strand:- start:1749 stop:2009 length:261 start_codon:yes stop_codon:yes gene_type:complete